MGSRRKWNCGKRIGTDEMGETVAVIALRPYAGLGASLGSWSSAITPWCPSSVARSSGVLPSSSTFLGLTSSRARSIFTTPSCPLYAANESGFGRHHLACRGRRLLVRVVFSPLPRAPCEQPTRVASCRRYLVCRG